VSEPIETMERAGILCEYGHCDCSTMICDFIREEIGKKIANNINIGNELTALRAALADAESALTRKGYRKSCGIPACNCGDQWNHGGMADERLREIYDELGMEAQGVTILDAVKRRGSALAECQRERLELARGFVEAVEEGEEAMDDIYIGPEIDLARRVIADAEETKP